MAKHVDRTYRSSAAQTKLKANQGKIAAARRELLEREEPMHRYPHPIPMAAPVSVPASAANAQATTQILEQLSCQSQLLMDLLGAVNSLTAALLCRTGTETD